MVALSYHSSIKSLDRESPRLQGPQVGFFSLPLLLSSQSDLSGLGSWGNMVKAEASDVCMLSYYSPPKLLSWDMDS